jgi:hypothetical protein
MSVNLHAEGNLDNTLRSPVNHEVLIRMTLFMSKKINANFMFSIHCVIQNYQRKDTAKASFI